MRTNTRITTNTGHIIDSSLVPPVDGQSVVVFVHGSGSGMHSPRNRALAQKFESHGYGTLLIDLLTFHEQQIDEQTRELRFDIPLLAQRVCAGVDFLQRSNIHVPIVLMGGSTGAAAALWSAALRQSAVSGVICRGGRVDLVPQECVEEVSCPVLFIVGDSDSSIIIESNANVAGILRDKAGVFAQVTSVPDAGHLFEEHGALSAVGDIALSFLQKITAGANTCTSEVT